jgi:hypothetical protein
LLLRGPVEHRGEQHADVHEGACLNTGSHLLTLV